MPGITDRLAALSPEKLQNLADRLLSQRKIQEKEKIRPRLPRPALIPLSYSQEGSPTSSG